MEGLLKHIKSCKNLFKISCSMSLLLVGVAARIPFIRSYEKHQKECGGPKSRMVSHLPLSIELCKSFMVFVQQSM